MRPLVTARAAALATIGALLTAGCTGTWGDSDASTVPEGPDDPYFPELGNGGYQVDHYDLAVRYDPAEAQLDGEITMQATARADASLSALEFDLVGLDVATVTVDGAAAATQRPGEKLQITPEEAVPAGEEFTVTVDYGGTPDTVHNPRLGSNGFHVTDDGGFAIGEPVSASTWFPVNAHPQDKATYDIALTVPDDTAAVSNGVPEGQEATDGWTTWRWHVPTPTASYLITAAIGDYRVHQDTHDDGLPMVTAVHEDLPPAADAQLRRTPEIADQLAEWFGPYPASAYGGIALSDDRIGFALETQSRPVYGPSFFAGGADATRVIVHELAHQWFGNSVSVHTWDEIWLNEGFATYAEWLWSENQGGDTAQEIFDATWDGPGADDSFWSPPPGDPGAEQLFSTPVYQRGAMALHALRRTVGDDAFFEILRTWADEHAGGNAITDDLITLSERVADRELDDLFDTWVYATERPAYPGD